MTLQRPNILSSTLYHQKILRIWGNLCAQSKGWKSSLDVCDRLALKKKQELFCYVNHCLWFTHIQLKALSCKEETNMIQKHRHLIWVQLRLQWTESKWKTVLINENKSNKSKWFLQNVDSTSSRLKTSSLVSVLDLKTCISDGMEVMELNKKYNKNDSGPLSC